MVTGSAVSLAGCLPMMAAGVADTAVKVAVGTPENNEHAAPFATSACAARAQNYGAVHVIDTQQRTPSQIIVWGTTEKDQVRRSFRCVFGTKIKSFSVRDIPAQK
ncbi:hypothetical protein [Sphingomonas abietis]|uniref:Lipoprotein n=1 Tax=Sphingomonas abietis TaxID=3012344 RepID=A0ABY7NKE1_9SPHN|nr:hypothetical protein [Sphingomonas abietis]WBO21707.1 hypothetical protein PBT88_16270 [Sphingomonas abietis]